MTKTTLITINTTVPAPNRPGAPHLVFFDNGDWEIACKGDVRFIEDSDRYVGATPAAEVLTALALEYDLDEMDEVDGLSTLYISVSVPVDCPEEPVIVLYDDGEFDVYERLDAEELVAIAEKSGVFNFIPFVDFMDELRMFVTNKRRDMMSRTSDEPNFDEDDR